MKITPEQIAGVIHEANRQLRLALGESPGPHWMECDHQHRESVINGVLAAQEGASPQELHEEWVRFKTAQGWTKGPHRDHSRRQHPCMVPYADLAPAQQLKQEMFHAMARALSYGQMAILIESQRGS